MHADQAPTATPDELPVTPQEEAAFRALTASDPDAAFALKKKALDWLGRMEQFAEHPLHRQYAAALLTQLAVDGPTRVNVTTLQDAEPVFHEVAERVPVPHMLQEVERFLLLTLERTHGSSDFPAAVHTETVSVVSREDLATSIRQIARHEDAFCTAHGPRFIRHRLLGVSSITLPVPVSDLLELAGMEDLQALLSQVPA